MARPKAARRKCKWPNCTRDEYVLKEQLCRAHYERHKRGAGYPNNPIRSRGTDQMKPFGPIRLPQDTFQRLRWLWKKLEVSDTVIAQVILVEALKDHGLELRLLRSGLGDIADRLS